MDGILGTESKTALRLQFDVLTGKTPFQEATRQIALAQKIRTHVPVKPNTEAQPTHPVVIIVEDE